MPLYNSASTIKQSIRSVLNQSYQNWELIIVDDGSTDNGPDLVNQINDSRVILYKQQNQGASAARNYGVTNSHGEYLAFLDSDDMWFPEKLGVDLQTLQKSHQKYAIIYSRRYSFNEKNQLINFSPSYTDAGMIFEAVLLKDNLVSASTCFIHKDMFEAVGGFPTFNRYHEDWYFLLLLAKRFPAYPTEQRLVLYKQTMSGKARKKFQDYDYAIKASIEGSEPLKDLLSQEDYNLFIEKQKASMCCTFMMYNKPSFAKKIFADVNKELLLASTKGKLAYLGLKTGMNFLYYARLFYQFNTRFLLLPWWRMQTNWAFS